MFKKPIILVSAGAVALVVIMAAMAANTTVKVTSNDLGSSWFAADTRAPGVGTFEVGPAAPPLGVGSFKLNTPDGSSKVQLLTGIYDGVRLADIEGIGYSTYRSAAPTGSPALAALNLRVDLTGDGNPDAYLVYEPYQDLGYAAIQDNVWQTWDAYRNGDAKWWINTGAAGCGQATPCTWDSIVAAFPDATIEEGTNCGPGNAVTPCPGSLGINQGSGNPGVVTNVDALYVSVGGDTTTYDFDVPVGPPATRDECKNGGWVTFDSPRPFTNQGDCVSYVETGR